MKEFVKACLFAAAATGFVVVGQAAFAANWLQTNAEPSVAVDIDSIRWNGDLATFAANLTVIPTPGTLAVKQASNYLVQISCTTKQIRLSGAGAIGSGNPLGSGSISPYTFQPAIGAVSDSMRRAVCPLNPAIAAARIAAANAHEDDPMADLRRQPAWHPPAFSPPQ